MPSNCCNEASADGAEGESQATQSEFELRAHLKSILTGAVVHCEVRAVA